MHTFFFIPDCVPMRDAAASNLVASPDVCLAHAQIFHIINFKVLFTIGGCVFPSSDNSKLS